VNSASSIEKSPERGKRSKATREPGSPGRVRRTRSVNPAKRSETPNMKSNGHETSTSRSTSRVNGHGLVSLSHPAQDMDAPLEQGRAASDDARDIPSAAAAFSAPAGTERGACAEVALPPQAATNGRRGKNNNQTGAGTPSATSQTNNRNEKATVNIPPGSEPLPADGAGFVDAMHKHVDLYKACARLVKSKDEKIAQRMSERLLEMKYGKGPSAAAEEAPEIVLDIDSAVAQRAAEGANK